jgi:cell division protein ZapA
VNKVKIKIGPRSYMIACDPADEEKVLRFGALIDENYAKLGTARAAQEADNMVFAALFMADELDEARRDLGNSRAELAEMRAELLRSQDDAANAIRKAQAEAEAAKEKSGNGKAELRAEIEALRRAEEQARKLNQRLKDEVAELQERARHQHDLFGGPAEDAAHSDALAEKLEALAARVEATASTLEAQTGAH